MIEGTTSTGFAYTITDEREDDYEVVKALKKWLGGDALAFWDFPRLLLGEEGEAALEEHCRKDGRISKEALAAEIREILKLKPVKN